MSRCGKYAVFGIVLGVLIATAFIRHAGASSVTVTAIVSENCGNGVIDSGETCDGANLGGDSCQSLGLGQGTLRCGTNCLFDTTSCSANPPAASTTPPSSSGGSNGGGGIPSNAPTTVIFSGRAYPKSTVTLLKDSAVLATTLTGSDATFQISVAGLSGGNYLFSLYSEGEDGTHSSLANFPVFISPGVTVKVSGVFIAPTITLDKDQVRSGDTITIAGQSAPGTDIVISIHSDTEVILKTAADTDGLYSYTYDTDTLDPGDHTVKARAIANGEVSPYGRSAVFRVGNSNIARKSSNDKADINNDGKVNLVDFSILAYWYKRPLPPARFDLNGDGKINLVDFSILAFHWTG